jgi:hypothetical protein
MFFYFICGKLKLYKILPKVFLKNNTVLEKSVEKIGVSIVSRWCDRGKILYDLMLNVRGLKVQKFYDMRLNTFFVFISALPYATISKPNGLSKQSVIVINA